MALRKVRRDFFKRKDHQNIHVPKPPPEDSRIWTVGNIDFLNYDFENLPPEYQPEVLRVNIKNKPLILLFYIYVTIIIFYC